MKRFLTNLKEINRNLEKQNSFKMIFLRGIIMGLGTAIGATVIAGIVIGVLGMTIDTIADVPVIGKLFEATTIDEVVKSSAGTD